MKRFLFSTLSPLSSALLCAIAAVVVTACNTSNLLSPLTAKATADHYPVLRIASTAPTGSQKAGAQLGFVFAFTSSAPMKEFNLYRVLARTASGVTTRDTAQVLNSPYKAAYSQLAQSDTLLVAYTVPALTLAAGQTAAINLIAEVVNQNGLNRRLTVFTGSGFTWAP